MLSRTIPASLISNVGVRGLLLSLPFLRSAVRPGEKWRGDPIRLVKIGGDGKVLPNGTSLELYLDCSGPHVDP